MSIEIRTVEADEMGELLKLDAALFGYAPEEDDIAGHLQPERTVCAFDGERMVGSSTALPLELTLPGGARVAMAGITWVGVLMTHRRRGIMRRLLTEQLARMEQTGEPVAGLGASESVLYRRFGFGPASRAARVEVEKSYSAFIAAAPPQGSLAHLDLAEALDVLPTLAERIRATRNGMVSRTAEMHRRSYKDAEKEKKGAGPVCFVAHRDEAGAIDGVVAYRVKLDFDDVGLAQGEVRIIELLSAGDAATAALWRHCLDHDLARRVVWWGVPVDDATADRLADPRRWTVRPHDDLHLRPSDIPTLLAARRYGREDALTIEVHDPLFADRGGRFRVEGGLDGATCTRVDRGAPDISLGTAALGSMLLGDAPAERLRRAGLVDEHTPGAVQRATAMFAWSPLPWASYMF